MWSSVILAAALCSVVVYAAPTFGRDSVGKFSRSAARRQFLTSIRSFNCTVGKSQPLRPICWLILLLQQCEWRCGKQCLLYCEQRELPSCRVCETHDHQRLLNVSTALQVFQVSRLIVTRFDSTQGYVALDTTNKLIVVSYQGTSTKTNPIDIFTDLDILQVQTTLCGTAKTVEGCKVHAGFYEAMVESSKVVTPIVAAAVKAHPTFRVVSTGHSLGGAISVLLGVQLRNAGYIVDIVSSFQHPIWISF